VRQRALGGTGVQVSALGLGTNQFGRVVDDAGAKAILDRASSSSRRRRVRAAIPGA